MNIIICKDYDDMSVVASKIIIEEINKKPNLNLGLATGSTPIGTYKELIKKYNEGVVDFSKVTSFNLDEYYTLDESHPQSYSYFMRENLFNHININLENTHIPNGKPTNLNVECDNYDLKISESGGIDLQILGIGTNAHIAFNEPSNIFRLGTDLVKLSESTIQNNSRFFNTIEEVPTKAISMGMGSIFQAKKIILLASGKSKAKAIYDTINSNLDPMIPSSILNLHNDVTLIIDEESASMIK